MGREEGWELGDGMLSDGLFCSVKRRTRTDSMRASSHRPPKLSIRAPGWSGDCACMYFSLSGKPKFRMIVEGANLFLSDAAREILEKAGVHVFKDLSVSEGPA